MSEIARLRPALRSLSGHVEHPFTAGGLRFQVVLNINFI